MFLTYLDTVGKYKAFAYNLLAFSILTNLSLYMIWR